MSRYDSDLDYYDWLNQPEPDDAEEPDEPEGDELMFCDVCQSAYTTTCNCDAGDDR